LAAPFRSERVDPREAPVGAHEGEALPPDPVGDRLVVTLTPAHQGRAQVEVPRAAGPRRGERAREELPQGARGERGDRPAGVGVVLHPEARVEQAQVLGHLRDRGHGRLERAAGDPLLDRDSRRDAGEPVDRGPRQLLDELPRVGRHRLHEPALALGEDDVEGQGRLPRAGDPGDDAELAMGDRDGEVLQVVLARPDDLDRRGGLRRVAVVVPALGGRQGELPVPGERLREEGRGRGPGARDKLGRALGHDPPAVPARLRADLDHPVRALQDVLIVLDHDQAVAAVDQRLQDAEEPADVMAVEPGGRLVEEE
jgi:hypothetical protein